MQNKNRRRQGTGFFCEIPFPDKKHMLKVLIITIIEIKEEDGINKYLELDDKIINDIINNDN